MIPWYMWLALIFFMFGVIYTIVQVGTTMGNNDSNAEMAKAIGSVTIVNSVLILVLAGAAHFYIAANEASERPYILLMLHVTLLLSIISISVSSLRYVKN